MRALIQQIWFYFGKPLIWSKREVYEGERERERERVRERESERERERERERA